MKLRSVLETNSLFNISRSVEHAIDFSGSFTWHMKAIKAAHQYITENIENINSGITLILHCKLPLYKPYYQKYSKQIEKMGAKIIKWSVEDFFLMKRFTNKAFSH